jgi:hypothetical protein
MADDDDDIAPILWYTLETTNLAVLHCIKHGVFGSPRRRAPAWKRERMQWDEFVQLHGSTPVFKQHLRMTLQSFNKLISLLVNSGFKKEVGLCGRNGGSYIEPEICLYCTIRWLAGGSYSDIFLQCGISRPSFFRVVWMTLQHIVKCNELAFTFPQSVHECQENAIGFKSISYRGAIDCCVSVVDGYLLEIMTPKKKEVGNVRSFYSGHYKCYGVNVQAASDHHCRFTYMAVAGPGVMGDREALQECSLYQLIENLPLGFVVISDNAYKPTERNCPIYGRADRLVPKYDNFSFFASQCRIRIEMAFGLMVKKWGILSRPLNVPIRKLKFIVLAIARLHNFVINERLSQQQLATNNMFRAVNNVLPGEMDHPLLNALDMEMRSLRDEAAHVDEWVNMSDFIPQWSMQREQLVKRIADFGLERPQRRGCYP